MKKKIITLIIISMLSVNLLACGSKKEEVKNDKPSITEDSSKKSETTTKSEDTKKTENSKKQTTTSTSTEAKASSVQAPAEIGQISIASKPTEKEPIVNRDVKISLTNVIRGDEAKKLADEFNSQHTAVKISPLDSSLLEYAVGEYSVTIPEDFPHDDIQPGIKIHSDIKGNDGEGLTYDGVLYCTTPFDINSNETEDIVLKPNKPEKGRFVFTIPKGCTNYLVEFGEFDGTKAYFKGK